MLGAVPGAGGSPAHSEGWGGAGLKAAEDGRQLAVPSGPWHEVDAATECPAPRPGSRPRRPRAPVRRRRPCAEGHERRRGRASSHGATATRHSDCALRRPRGGAPGHEAPVDASRDAWHCGARARTSSRRCFLRAEVLRGPRLGPRGGVRAVFVAHPEGVRTRVYSSIAVDDPETNPKAFEKISDSALAGAALFLRVFLIRFAKRFPQHTGSCIRAWTLPPSARRSSRVSGTGSRVGSSCAPPTRTPPPSSCG